MFLLRPTWLAVGMIGLVLGTVNAPSVWAQAAGAFELRDHLFDGMGADHVGAIRFLGEKVIDLRHGPVVNDYGETVIVHVQNEILSHDGQANERDVSFRFHV